jgi:hypothetical protein
MKTESLTRRPPARAVRAGAIAALATASVLAAGCGSTPGGTASAAQPVRLPLATSEGGTGQPGWAVVPMGGSSANYENFWELFARPAGSAQWKLATPLGVASNGGLAIAGVGPGLVAGFQPSQDLTFSPLASTVTSAGAWSQNAAPVTPGLASVPDALAAGPAGHLLALTGTGEVLLSANNGASWSRLTTLRLMASTRAGRVCGLAALTAVAFTPADTPLVGGACTRPGSAGVFIPQRHATEAAQIPVRAALPVTVLGLARQAAGRTMAVLRVGQGRTATAVAAWLGQGSGGATVSAPVGAGADGPRSIAIWANGSAGLVLAGRRAVTIAGPGATWQALPAVPAQTSTLALGPAGQPEALVARGGTLTIWQLAAGGSWRQVQRLKVTIPYGSSG